VGAATDYYDLAAAILGVAHDALAQLPAGAPDRSYVGHGLPAIDCEQLVVSSYVQTQADTSPRALPMDRQFRPKYGSVNIPVFVVSIVRCYPEITMDNRQEPIFPSVAALTAASELLYADAWQVWNALMTAKREGDFGGLCREMSLDPMTPINPSGGYAGWTLPIEAQLDGFAVSVP
jgi:hypothetical protein